MSDLSSDRTETDGEFLARVGADGQKWANEFLGRCGDRITEDTSPGSDFNHITMGWFANAIEAGRTAGYSQGYEQGYITGMNEGSEINE